MDWLHISIADLLKCETILTTDSSFRRLKDYGSFLPLDNVRKALIFPGKEEKLGSAPESILIK